MAKRSAADDVGDQKEGANTLCGDCRDYDHGQHDFNGHVLRLCVEEATLRRKVREWGGFLDTLLKITCAARNTCLGGRSCWVLLIHIRDSKTDAGYGLLLSEKLTDKLKPMTLGSCFSETYQISSFCHDDLAFLNFSVLPDFAGIVAKHLRSPQSYDHCLFDADLEYIVDFLFCKEEVPTEMMSGLREMRDKSDGVEVLVQESACVQLKSLKPEENIENLRKVKSKRQQDIFRPESGADVVEWIWKKQNKTLGEYVSAFAKLRTGGLFYVGVREESGKNIIRALDLTDEWKREIEDEVEKKMKEDMLWVKRNPNSREGYTVLGAGDIKKGQHFDVDFIPVSDPKSAESSLYILEIKVASFNGVVFNHKGPEVYEFQEDEGSYKAVPVDALTWVQRLQQHAWCSNYKTPRKPRCGQEDWCSQCLSQNKVSASTPQSPE